MKEILDQIEEAMERQDMSLSELSEAAGISRMQLYRVFQGQSSPTVEWLEKVSEALGFSGLSLKE